MDEEMKTENQYSRAGKRCVGGVSGVANRHHAVLTVWKGAKVPPCTSAASQACLYFYLLNVTKLWFVYQL